MADKDGGLAFPLVVSDDLGIRYETGMSLRDWFAGQVAAGLAAHQTYPIQDIPGGAYEVADAMLAARANPTTEPTR